MSKEPSFKVVEEKNITEEKKVPTVLETVVKKFGKGAYIYLSKSMIGKKVRIVFLE